MTIPARRYVCPFFLQASLMPPDPDRGIQFRPRKEAVENKDSLHDLLEKYVNIIETGKAAS